VRLSGIVPLPQSVERATAFDAVAGESALRRVVRLALAAVDEPGRVVVAAAEPLTAEARAEVADLTAAVVSVTGDATDVQCVRAAVDYLDRERISASHLLLYDVARPLTPADVQHRVLTGLRDGAEVVAPALPVTDSVKTVDDVGSVTATLDRSTLREGQSPRGFERKRLGELLTGPGDPFSAAVDAGVPITLVDGDADAFLVVLPRDAQYVDALIASRRPDLRGS